MSSFSFQPNRGPILVNAEITGPLRTAVLRLVLDTGATTSLINLPSALFVGIAPNQSGRRIPMVTGTTTSTVPIVIVTRISALGQHRFGFPVIAHALPSSSAVDGLLGLDFFRSQLLTIDFRTGLIAVS